MKYNKTTALAVACAAALVTVSAISGDKPPFARKGSSVSSSPERFERPLWLSHEVRSRAIRVADGVVGLKLEWDDPLLTGNDLTEHVQYNWSVAYEVSDVAGSLGPHEFVVWGLARNGDVVVEHFDLTPPVGAHYIPDTTSSLPTFSIVGGGSYLPPSERTAASPPVREELYRGGALGQDVLVANDPNRQYSYIISRDLEGLHCVNWANGSVTECDLGADKALLSSAQSANVQAHSTEGNKLKIVLGINDVDADYILLSDYDGDGLFDGHQVVDAQGYSLLGYPQLWSNDYVVHLDFLSPL